MRLHAHVTGSAQGEVDAARRADAALGASPTRPIIPRPSAPSAVSGTGARLPEGDRAFFEPRFGHDFGRVRIHSGPSAVGMAAAQGARAFATGDDIVLGAEAPPLGTPAGRRLLAHELAHVVQQRVDPQTTPLVQRDRSEPPTLTSSGDRVRESPPGGVAIRNGTLTWRLRYRGQPFELRPDLSIVTPSDVELIARYTPTPGATAVCPTVTFVQTVIATAGGAPDFGRLLITRDAASGASIDTGVRSTEPYYGLGPRPTGAGLQGDTGQTPGSIGGAGSVATHGDAPYQRELNPGRTAERRFEAAVVCVESAETFGSLSWGFTKTSNGVITLIGGQVADVRTRAASPQFEGVRQAFYRGQFQHSLSGFAVGSAVLTPAHQASLASIPLANLTRIVLAGANDNSGGPEAVAALSLQRARAARDYLVNTLHVPSSIITVEGHGVAARLPNPAGTQVPENRRVDVRYDQGAEVAPSARRDSPGELARIRRQDPRVLVDEAVDRILDLDAATRPLTTRDTVPLLEMLRALEQWRQTDPTVPDLRAIYAAQLARILRSVPQFQIPRQRPVIPPTPLVPPTFIPRIEEDARRLILEDRR
jgi:outer membrane protein OmpA-like peptidoglycan-associated protein